MMPKKIKKPAAMMTRAMGSFNMEEDMTYQNAH